MTNEETNTMKTLTNENAKVGMAIENENNPSWGTFKITSIDLFDGRKLISAGQKSINNCSEWNVI